MPDPIIKYALAAALSVLFWSTGLAAADERMSFEQALKMLESGKYCEAESLFSDLFVSDNNPQNGPRDLFYQAKAAYYAESLEKSRGNFDRLISSYPQSPYIPYGYFYLGNIYYRLGRETNAMIAYLDAYRLSSDKKLDSLILNSIEAAIGVPRSMALKEISYGVYSEERKCRLAVSVGRGLLKQKNYQSVPAVLSGCTGLEASALLAEADRLLREEPQIGIALPLSGELQKYGESLLEGAMLMAEDFTRESGRKIIPVIYDTRGESVEAARIARRLAARGVTAFIGPLTSEETAVTSATLSCSDLPMIAPAASQSGLTELSPNCYQLQPTLDLQGARMAEFAILQKKFDTAVIITPTIPENLRMARAFSRRFTELGGKVLGIEYFRAHDTDFGPLLLDIKSLAMGNLSESLIFINEKGDTLEPREVPINLECLYIPADAYQLAQLLPQVNFYNIKATFLGGEGWGEKSVFDLGRDITGECYFASGRIGGDNPVSGGFAAAFLKEYEQEPGYLGALGYDAMALICQAFSAGNNTRLEISHYLSTVKDYKGAAGNVSFDANRENTAMPVYTIISGKSKRVEF